MTTEERLEKLEKELARAKRRNRWLLRGAGLCLGLGLLAWAFGAEVALAQPAGAAPKRVSANMFVVVDENGKRRAKLSVSKGGPSLILFDENGKGRAALTVVKDRPGLILRDPNGKIRATLVVLKTGPRLGLLDENGEFCARLAVLEDGPALDLLDENGQSRATLGCVGLTTIKDGTLTKRPESSLVLFDKEGKVTWETP